MKRYAWLAALAVPALFPPLSFFSSNLGMFSFSDACRVVLFTFLIVFLFAVFSVVLFRDLSKVLVTTSASVLLFFSYGHMEFLLRNLEFQLGFLRVGPGKFLAPIFFLLFAGLHIAVRKSHRDFSVFRAPTLLFCLCLS